MNLDWIPYDDNYEKRFYEIKLSGGAVVQHLWPNAGEFHSMHGASDIVIYGSDVEFIRPCRCGNKWGGCDGIA